MMTISVRKLGLRENLVDDGLMMESSESTLSLGDSVSEENLLLTLLCDSFPRANT